MQQFHTEVKRGERFEFGKNWMNFLKTLDTTGIESACKSIQSLLAGYELSGKSFLDVGSGSGLSSLAARKMGTKNVVSFDYDPDSVNSTLMLKNRYLSQDENWIIQKGSVLDSEYLKTLGRFDVVYSWGVLHHSGNMWEALSNVSSLVNDHGILFIALYNDQAYKSVFWKKVKKTYCSSRLGKLFVSSVFYPLFFLIALTSSLIHKKNIFKAYKKNRGMSIMHDWKDWLGGFPFEVAKIEEVFNFFKLKGFSLFNIKTTTSMGCNEYVFVRNDKG